MDKRKTQDNVKETAIARPSTRISRLAQPRKYSATPHSLNRNRLSATENVASYNRQINKRARSATPHTVDETPARPPIARSLSVQFTPASSNKSVVLKKPANEQISRILEVLRNSFGPNFLPGGLQSMSAKQFVEIVRFFAQSICGDKIVIQDNNVDDVKRFVDFIEYPHQMNKSWFKAPTVSVAYDRNVEFLDWLCDFISFGDGDTIFDDMEENVGESGNFVDQEFGAGFVGDVKNGYVIWSHRIKEFDEWKSKWIYKMIAAKTEMDDIDAAIERLENDCESIQAKDSSFGKEQLLKTQRKKRDELSVEVSNMKAAVDEKNTEFQETSSELNTLILKHEEITSSVNELKATIKRQEVSAEDRQKIIADVDRKRQLLIEKEKFVASLKSIGLDNQVKIARFRQQKISKLFGFNTIIQKLFQIGNYFGHLTIDQLSFQENDTKDQIKTKLELFAQIKEMINQRRADIQTGINETNPELTSISNLLFKIEDEIGAHKNRIHSMEIQMRKIENEIVDLKYDSEQEQHQLQMKIDNSQQKYERIDAKIKNSEKLAETLKEENERIFQGIEMKSNTLLRAKRERQASQEAALEELKKLTDQLRDDVNNLS